jgi:hypothetical protein
MPERSSIPGIPGLNSLRDSMPIRRCPSSVPIGWPVLLVQLAAERRYSDDSHRSPGQVVNRPETSCPANFREHRHRNSQVAAALNALSSSARIHPETEAHSTPARATQALATAASRPSADAAHCARSADYLPFQPRSRSSRAAEDYWSVQLLRHSSLAAARCSPQAEPPFRAQQARELDQTRFPAHEESFAMASTVRSCQRMASVRCSRFRRG